MTKNDNEVYDKNFESGANTMLTHLAHHIQLVERSSTGGVYVITQLGNRSWGVFEISGSDLLQLCRSDTMPNLSSARVEAIAETKRRCLEEFEYRQRRKAIALIDGQEFERGDQDARV